MPNAKPASIFSLWVIRRPSTRVLCFTSLLPPFLLCLCFPASFLPAASRTIMSVILPQANMPSPPKCTTTINKNIPPISCSIVYLEPLMSIFLLFPRPSFTTHGTSHF
ncbi:hypothetical protein B0T25DRAFT_90914 [Lasiosphaeria hispida]|uniref:Uncharacterized protein n=1 Tax=Lasiosphaeria hispida TaxID=260671 RepID=A0AAJ0HPT5_9PEZI|nr:hypothetical protein B0T25DRAFT_90914 [Lasiosphaeria hispida]